MLSTTSAASTGGGDAAAVVARGTKSSQLRAKHTVETFSTFTSKTGHRYTLRDRTGDDDDNSDFDEVGSIASRNSSTFGEDAGNGMAGVSGYGINSVGNGIGNGNSATDDKPK